MVRQQSLPFYAYTYMDNAFACGMVEYGDLYLSKANQNIEITKATRLVEGVFAG